MESVPNSDLGRLRWRGHAHARFRPRPYLVFGCPVVFFFWFVFTLLWALNGIAGLLGISEIESLHHQYRMRLL